MKETKTLLIPITLRAFLSGREPDTKIYSGYELNFSDLDDADIPIDNGLFVSRQAPPPGVHLHFSLPEGFTHGTQNENGDEKTASITYPKVPNRFAVTRMWQEKGKDRISVKTFLVESDALLLKRGQEYLNQGSSSYPYPDTPKHPYRYLGRSYPLSQYSSVDQDIERLPLTAVSPVNPYFASYYPHCRNVFGFFDDLPQDGIEEANLTYMVCGWYQDAAGSDPLFTVQTLEELEKELFMNISGDILPSKSICHGIISEILWKGADCDYPSGVPGDAHSGQIEDKPAFAAGSTAGEAFSALAGHYGNIPPRLFHYFLTDLHPELANEGNTFDADKELLLSAFSSLMPPDLPRLCAKPGQPLADPPGKEVLIKLDKLRSRQRDLFQQQIRLQQKQRSAYECWQLIRTGLDDAGTAYPQLQAAAAEVHALSVRLSKEALELEKEIRSFHPGEGYELKTEPDAPFYQPQEPVLLMRQLANTDAKVTGHAVFCRYMEECNTSLVFTKLSPASISLTGEELLESIPAARCLPEEFGILLKEAVLLSPGFSLFLAEKALAKAGIAPSPKEAEELGRTIRQVQLAFRQIPGIAFDRIMPDARAVTAYKPQWYPLYMEWQCSYYPDSELLKDIPDLKNWTFQNGSYYYCGDESITSSGNRYPISGRMLLSDNADRQMERMIQNYFDKTDFAPQKADPRTPSFLSQSLDGFNDTLLMRDNMSLLPLFTTDSRQAQALSLLQGFSSEQMNAAAFFDELFAPIRAGFLSFDKIRILDQLGRFQEISEPDMFCSEEMKMPGAPAKVHNIMLPPRLVQYSRLDARWFCTGKEMEDAEAGFTENASPLCGFLLPNLLDNSIMAYTAEGNPVGSLVLTGTGKGVTFRNPPGQPITYTIPTDIDPSLYQVLYHLQNGPRENLSALLSYINRLAARITPKNHAIADIDFIGRPFALARIKMKLETAGDFEAYRHLQGQEPDRTGSANVKKAVFPVWLGEKADYRDGLAGFFLNQDFSHFRIFPDTLSSSDYFINSNQILCTPNPNQTADEVHVLMDPYGRLTIQSGILPAITMELPRELTEQALENICVSYFAAPLLSNCCQLDIPAPYLDSKEYYFYQIQKQNWHITKLERKDLPALSAPYPQTAMEGYIQIHKKEETHNHAAQ